MRFDDLVESYDPDDSDDRFDPEPIPAIREPVSLAPGEPIPSWAGRCLQILEHYTNLCSYGRIRKLSSIASWCYLRAISQMAEHPRLAVEVVATCCEDSHWMPHPARLREEYARRLGAGPGETPSETVARHRREEEYSRRHFPEGRVGPTEREIGEQLRRGEARPMPEEIRERVRTMAENWAIPGDGSHLFRGRRVRSQPVEVPSFEETERRRQEALRFASAELERLERSQQTRQPSPVYSGGDPRQSPNGKKPWGWADPDEASAC